MIVVMYIVILIAVGTLAFVLDMYAVAAIKMLRDQSSKIKSILLTISLGIAALTFDYLAVRFVTLIFISRG